MENTRTIQMIFVAAWMCGYIGAVGVTGGAHRYWTHRSYRAKLPLRILLAAIYLMAGMVKCNKGITDT
jgi:stearoyl-CoA desaturase (delta-9 desaturase)